MTALWRGGGPSREAKFDRDFVLGAQDAENIRRGEPEVGHQHFGSRLTGELLAGQRDGGVEGRVPRHIAYPQRAGDTERDRAAVDILPRESLDLRRGEFHFRKPRRLQPLLANGIVPPGRVRLKLADVDGNRADAAGPGFDASF